ncbi:hypothetical protein OH492_15035 [Vibrio chagasii]|nr:hypothetical protein [Vibrio chagasii]
MKEWDPLQPHIASDIPDYWIVGTAITLHRQALGVLLVDILKGYRIMITQSIDANQVLTQKSG